MKKDKEILRELAVKYAEAAADPIQKVHRDMWRAHNSLKKTRPLIYTRAFAWKEMPDSALMCRDPFFRVCENFFRYRLFWIGLNDDSIFEPWITVRAEYKCEGWGVEISKHETDNPNGAFKVEYPIVELEDIEKLRMPWHEIDEEKTKENIGKLYDAIGDIITINLDRQPYYTMWHGDISTDLGYLRGIENFMMDMVLYPDWLHKLCRFLGEGVHKTHNEAEEAGDWNLSAHQNQAMPYAEELKDPAPNKNGVKRSQLWGYMAAQELTGVSPEMHEEFILQYQLPILKHFGLVAYGCCEDLTKKIDMLRQIPNLRRIAVSPFAKVAECAEQIGDEYVLSYRPSPADMVSYDFNEDRIRNIVKRDLEICKSNNCHVDITLKDVETVNGDPTRVRKWVELTREIITEVYG